MQLCFSIATKPRGVLFCSRLHLGRLEDNTNWYANSHKQQISRQMVGIAPHSYPPTLLTTHEGLAKEITKEKKNNNKRECVIVVNIVETTFRHVLRRVQWRVLRVRITAVLHMC